jgi:hypothetical protein
MDVAQQVSGKERVRGQKLVVFIKGYQGVPMEEALRRADDAGVVVASNKRISQALIGSEEWRGIREVFVCWSGTMAAYDEPDRKLGKAIVYTEFETDIRYIFLVPQEHQGKKNVLLVAEHPKFSLVHDGNDRIVQATEVGAVERFPTSEGWFLGDPKYDIPTGNRVDGNKYDARYLWRVEKRVGLAARNSWIGFDYGRIISLNASSFDGLGVAVEAKAKDSV